VDPDEQGSPRKVELEIRGVGSDSRVRVSRIDAEHGNSLAAYRAMGNPRYPTRKQVEKLNRAAEIPPAETARLTRGSLEIELPVNGVALIEVPRK